MTPATPVPALYDVVIGHTRRAPLENSFDYRSFYWLIDIDAPPKLPAPLRWLARFDPRDHLDIRAVLAEHGLGADRILMLANARTLGYVFNPISVYWCYRHPSATHGAPELVALVAEVHNTYGGRHAYVLHPDEHGRAEVDKQMYVSPFYPVDGRYSLRISPPGESISVTVTLRRDGDEPFVATLRGRRRPATLRNLVQAWMRYPWAPLRVSALIRWQGIRLWRRGLEVQPR
ncbi:MAG TPA: DUF1365 domain-containing protein [Mycobacteriales bacterium]|nr:DUF1365 domain-containing protein [Mycobacteriales bacterium]